MFKLGNIVLLDKEDYLTDKIISLKDNPTLLFYSSIDEIKDKTLPTLVIGWKLLKEKIKKVSILNKKIENNLFWTFSSKEKIQEFNENIDEFIRKLANDFVTGISYKLIDPIVKNITSPELLVNEIPDELITYSNEEMLYCFSKNKKTVFSVDFQTIDFLGWNFKKLIELIKLKSISFTVEEYNENSALYKYKKYINLEEINKFIPFFIYKETLEEKEAIY